MKNTITYAIGDVHGCFEKLIALLAHCDAHSGSRKPRFVFLGDYVDRGWDSNPHEKLETRFATLQAA